MLVIEKDMASTIETVGSLRSYMDQAGILVPEVPDHVAASILFAEVRPNLFFTIYVT